MRFEQETAEVSGKNICRTSWIKRLTLWAILLSAMLLLSRPPIQAQQDDENTVILKYAIPIGEQLAYSIYWDPPWYLFFLPPGHAGDVEIKITDGIEYQGRKVLKIVFKARSTGTLAKLSGMKIDDEFIFHSEPESLCTLNVSKKIREGKRKRHIDVEYFRDAGKLRMHMYDESVNPRKLMRDSLKDDIPPCVQDPLSALYFLRQSPLDADSVITSIIGHDDVVKEVQSHVEKLEDLDTTAGKIPTWRLKTVALMGGLFKKDGQFKIWLSADDRQVPLQFEVKVSIGRILGRLKEAENPKPEE